MHVSASATSLPGKACSIALRGGALAAGFGERGSNGGQAKHRIDRFR